LSLPSIRIGGAARISTPGKMRALLWLLLMFVPSMTSSVACPPTLHPACRCEVELSDRISIYCSSVMAETALQQMEGLALERLQLANCSFESIETPFKLTSLKVLEIDNCGLTAFSDQSINSIAFSLEELHLANNMLTSVPLLRSLPNLVILNLNGNSINDLPEGSFDGLPKLRQLRVRSNKICSLSANSLGETKSSLELLDLGRNCLGGVPAAALRNSQRLTYLDLSSNKIAEIGNFNLMNLPRLRELTLNDNILNKIHPMAFMNVPELQFLYMRNNLISNLDGNRLQAFPKLEILDARNNMLSKLPSFKDQPNLKEIRLDGNLILKVETLAFTSNPRLQLISLQDNAISVVARNSFDSLDRLVVLLLSNNSIKSIDRGMLDGMKNLQQLNMRNNSITEIDKDSFAPLKLLTTIDLANNQLKSIGQGTFDVMNKLFWLDLSGNQLRTIKKGVFKKKVSNIVLNGNPLQCDADLDDFVTFLVVNRVRTFLPAQPEITCAGPATMEGERLSEIMMKKAAETKDEPAKTQGNQQFLNSILPALSIGGLGAGKGQAGGLGGLGDLSALANALPGLKGMLGGGGVAPPVPQRAANGQVAATPASPAATHAAAGVGNVNFAALSPTELETLIAALPPMSVNIPGYGELDVSKLPPSLVAHALRGGQIPGVPKEALDQVISKYVAMMRQMVSNGLQQQQREAQAHQQGSLQQPPTAIQTQPIAAAIPSPNVQTGQPAVASPVASAAPTLPLTPQSLEMLKLLPTGYNISRIPMEVMTAISRGEVPDLNLLPRDLQTHLMSNSNQMLTMFSKNAKGGSIDELLSKLPKWERPDLPTFSPYDINDIHNELVQEEEAATRQAQLRVYSAIALAAIGAISIFVVGLLCYCNRKNRSSSPLHHTLPSSATAGSTSFHGRSMSIQAV
ncbi:hypothetical protein PMAYCL1PPCAC_31220, partial [Pristionchus mayeri]